MCETCLMASIYKVIHLRIAPDRVWEAIRDIGNAHERLFPGVLKHAYLQGDGRVVEFTNGLVVEELTVELDDEKRRYAWAATGGNLEHHNASLHVFDADEGSSIVWITDVLPHSAREAVCGLVDAGAAAMKATLERAGQG
jgi:hypothetical protein